MYHKDKYSNDNNNNINNDNNDNNDNTTYEGDQYDLTPDKDSLKTGTEELSSQNTESYHSPKYYNIDIIS